MNKGRAGGDARVEQGKAGISKPPSDSNNMVFWCPDHPHLGSKAHRMSKTVCASCQRRVYYWETGSYHKGFGCRKCNPNSHAPSDMRVRGGGEE